jgi:hypothetical protein
MFTRSIFGLVHPLSVPSQVGATVVLHAPRDAWKQQAAALLAALPKRRRWWLW